MLRSKVADSGYTKMLERFARECPKNQFLREFVKNGVQAIQRYIQDTGDKDYKGIVEVDVNWYFHSLGNVNKISFTDNGIGMTGEEMTTFVNDLSSSSDKFADYDNYGFGAKVAAAITNKLGIQYESWKDGKGHLVKFYYDPNEKAYGLEQFNTDGEYKYFVPITDEVKPTIIKNNGTRVTLFGNDEKSDTYDCRYHDINATRESWVLSYLNKRFFDIPENISLKARIGHDRPVDDSRHNYLANVGGLKKTLEKFTLKKGKVNLTDAIVEWRILDENRKGHGREFVAGHTSVLHENEVFDISSGVGNKAIHFGIYVGYKNVSLNILPTTREYVQNTTRSNVVFIGEDTLPWERWQTEFIEKFPPELTKYINDTMSSISKEDSSEDIKNKLKDLREFYNVSKYKRSKNGKYFVNDDDLMENLTGGSEAIKSKGGKNGTKKGKGNVAGIFSDLISMQIKEDGVSASKVNPDPFPKVIWIKPSESDSIEEDEILDRAAVYRETENIVFANKEYMGFVDVNNYFMKEFPSLPAENIVKITEDIFSQQLMETIAGALTLKNREHWDPDDFKKAISPESLSISVASRYYFFREIKRKLGDPNLQLKMLKTENQQQEV